MCQEVSGCGRLAPETPWPEVVRKRKEAMIERSCSWHHSQEAESRGKRLGTRYTLQCHALLVTHFHGVTFSHLQIVDAVLNSLVNNYLIILGQCHDDVISAWIYQLWSEPSIHEPFGAIYPLKS